MPFNVNSKISSKSIRIDLSQMKTISINGLLYLVSEIDILQSRKDMNRFNFSKVFKYNAKFGPSKNNIKLRYLLDKIGYWEYFGIKTPYKVDSSIENEYFLSIQTDTLSKSQYVAQLRDFIYEKVHFIKSEAIQDYFDDAITEAMANSVEHGYIKETPFRTKGKWWLCGHYEKKKDYLEFSFRDYGVGLRSTLEYNADNMVKSFMRNVRTTVTKSDAQIIKELVNNKLPKYKDKKDKIRGYGFKKFKEFAQNIGYNCEMKIISNHGKYDYRYFAYNGTEEENIETLNFDVKGFIISWKIYLGDKKNV